jgi:hypothetical protein
MPIVLQYGNLNLMEPWGLVQACTRISLPLWCHITLNNIELVVKFKAVEKNNIEHEYYKLYVVQKHISNGYM